jgi:Flp pilus assembly protein TadD
MNNETESINKTNPDPRSDCGAAMGGSLSGDFGAQQQAACDLQLGIRGRVQKQLHYANQQAQKRLQLSTLDRLLEKNPDVALILDLIEATRY